MNVIFSLTGLLLAGNHYLFTEISFIVYFLLSIRYLSLPSISNIRIKLVLIIILLVLLTFTLREWSDVTIIAAFLFMATCKFSQNNIDHLYQTFTKLHLCGAIIILIGQIIVQDKTFISDLLCLYGEYRSTLGCDIQPYGTVGNQFYRLYGFASEPSVYGVFILFCIIYERLKDIRVDSSVFKLQIFALFLTFSIAALILLLVVVLFNKNFKIIPKLNLVNKVNIIIIAGFVVILLFLSDYMDIFIARTFTRVMDALEGDDYSAYLRTVGTLNPLKELLMSELLFHGVGLSNTSSYIKGVTTTYFVEDPQALIVDGQVTSAFIYYIIAFGPLSVFIVLLLISFRIGFLNLSILILMLLFTPYARSFIPIILICLLNTSYQPRSDKRT